MPMAQPLERWPFEGPRAARPRHPLESGPSRGCRGATATFTMMNLGTAFAECFFECTQRQMVREISHEFPTTHDAREPIHEHGYEHFATIAQQNAGVAPHGPPGAGPSAASSKPNMCSNWLLTNTLPGAFTPNLIEANNAMAWHGACSTAVEERCIGTMSPDKSCLLYTSPSPRDS